VSPHDTFILTEEVRRSGNFRVGQLFIGDLRLITPLLWIGYTASSLAIYFSASWGPIVLEELKFPRQTSALVASTGSLAGAVAGLLLMRFTDRRGRGSVAFYPALAVPVLLALGFGLVTQEAFLGGAVLAALLISVEHFGILSIAGIFYPSAIRASGAGWATSVAKLGAIVGPIIGAVVLSSGMPIMRSYALLTVCPAILCGCALGIAAVARQRLHPAVPDRSLAVASAGSGDQK